MLLHPEDDRFGSAAVGGEGDVVYVADSHQRAHIGFVRLSRERIAEEENRGDAAFRDASANDEVATIRSVGDPFDRQPEFIMQQPSGIPCGDECLPTEVLSVKGGEGQEFRFPLVMGNEGDHPE